MFTSRKLGTDHGLLERREEKSKTCSHVIPLLQIGYRRLFPSDETTSQSTRLSTGYSQVAGYKLARIASKVAGYVQEPTVSGTESFCYSEEASLPLVASVFRLFLTLALKRFSPEECFPATTGKT